MTIHHVEVQSRVLGRAVELEPVLLELLEEQISVRELVRRTVEEQVRDLIGRRALDNKSARQTLERQYLTDEEIAAAAAQGRVSLPKLSSSGTNLNAEREVERALKAFESRKFQIFIEGRQIESLDEQLSFREQTRVTFLRLMPLAGG